MDVTLDFQQPFPFRKRFGLAIHLKQPRGYPGSQGSKESFPEIVD